MSSAQAQALLYVDAWSKLLESKTEARQVVVSLPTSPNDAHIIYTLLKLVSSILPVEDLRIKIEQNLELGWKMWLAALNLGNHDRKIKNQHGICRKRNLLANNIVM